MYLIAYLVLSLFESSFGLTINKNPLVIQTKNGAVKGITLTAGNGKEVDAWNSIPYAEPPLNKLRFRPPLPIQNWNDTKDTKSFPPSCYQYIEKNPENEEKDEKLNDKLDEDCLYLTVTVPKPRPINSAVMFYIYGGGFEYGSSTKKVHDYRILASEQNIIVVAPQYRISSFGFFYFGTNDTSGNAGLFDQLLALQWVNDNIEYFGGDKQKITIFGHSAGAASVGMHLLSPLSRNLFSRAIMQSGSPLNLWAIENKPAIFMKGIEFVRKRGCLRAGESLEMTINCLKEMSPLKLVVNSNQTAAADFKPPFLPIVDNLFLTKPPQKLLKEGNFKNIPIMIGITADELSIYLIKFFQGILKNNATFISSSNFEISIDILFKSYNDKTRASIIQEYTSQLNFEDAKFNYRDIIKNMMNDALINCGVTAFADIYTYAGNDVFFYLYNHRSSIENYPEWVKSPHIAEIPFLFGQPFNVEYSYTDEEKALSKKIMKYWTNFAKSGNPSKNEDGTETDVVWPLRTASDQSYLILDAEMSSGHDGPRAKHCAFWSNLDQLKEKLG